MKISSLAVTVLAAAAAFHLRGAESFGFADTHGVAAPEIARLFLVFLAAATYKGSFAKAAPGDCFPSNDKLRDAAGGFMSQGCSSDPNCATVAEWGPIGDWCFTPEVTKMRFLFSLGSGSTFNEDISRWDVSSITTMQSMFAGASEFNQDLSGWDTSAIKDLAFIFDGAAKFNGDISTWDTSKVTNMAYAFRGAKAFNRDLSKWDTSNVLATESMFESAVAFNQDISSWSMAKNVYAANMFRTASAFNQNLCSWKDYLPTAATKSIFLTGEQSGIFKNSGCTVKDDTGFCAVSDCNAPAPDTPSKVPTPGVAIGTPTATKSSSQKPTTPPEKTYCGCPKCTQAIWDTPAIQLKSDASYEGDSRRAQNNTCGERITWYQTGEKFSETGACGQIARNYVECDLCDPDWCHNQPKWYPDWQGDNQGCIQDGNEPGFMSGNPTQYLFKTSHQCCLAHYSWKVRACTGESDVIKSVPWYPDYYGKNRYCINDGKQPSWMEEGSNAKWYLFATKKECCNQLYRWNTECLQSTLGMWYPNNPYGLGTQTSHTEKGCFKNQDPTFPGPPILSGQASKGPVEVSLGYKLDASFKNGVYSKFTTSYAKKFRDGKFSFEVEEVLAYELRRYYDPKFYGSEFLSGPNPNVHNISLRLIARDTQIWWEDVLVPFTFSLDWYNWDPRDSLDSCCETYYLSYIKGSVADYKQCIKAGDPSYNGSGKWYINSMPICVRDCLTGSNCGGFLDERTSWIVTTFRDLATLRDTAEECCKEYEYRFPSPRAYDTCMASSGSNPNYVGTSKWYTNWRTWNDVTSAKKCVKDCRQELGNGCGGPPSYPIEWVRWYDRLEHCCGQFDWPYDLLCQEDHPDPLFRPWYMKYSQYVKGTWPCGSPPCGQTINCCFTQSTFDPYNEKTTGTKKWYKKDDGICVKDCASANKYCGGIVPSSLYKIVYFYDTYSECCNLEWEDKNSTCAKNDPYLGIG